MDQATANEPETKTNGKDTSTTSLLPSVLAPLLNLIQPVSLSFPPLPSTSTSTLPPPPIHAPTTSVLSAIHVSAFECLNNVFLSLSVTLTEGGEGLVKNGVEDGKHVWNSVWSALEKVGLEGGRGQERRKEMWEAAVGVLWGIGNVWKGSIVSCIHAIKMACIMLTCHNRFQMRTK